MSDVVSEDYRTSKGKLHRSWHGKTTFALAKELGADLETLYEVLYRDTSSSVHPSNMDSRHYVAQDDDGAVRAVLELEDPRRTRSDWVLSLAAKLLLDFAAATDERLDLGDAEVLAELDAELMQLLKESSEESDDLD